jgi:hypothetical protein
MIDWRKLRHEWKTFAVGVASVLVGLYDGIIAQSLDWTPLVPERYRPYAPFIVGVLMLLLRRYKDPE